MTDRTLTAIFSAFYRLNLWFNGESRSGPGSTLAATAAIREALPPLLRELGVRTLLDLPCGDCSWIRTVELGIDEYIGADIVAALVDANRRSLAGPGRRFLRLDITCDPLPAADPVLCRDGLVHLADARVRDALVNIARSGTAYLLTTTFPKTRVNRDYSGPHVQDNFPRSLRDCPEFGVHYSCAGPRMQRPSAMP